MKEDSKSLLAGQPNLLVRSLLMQGIDEVWDEWLVQYVLKVERPLAEQIIEELAEKGLIEPVRSQAGRKRLWETSIAGQAMTGIIRIRPMPREAVERKLSELVAKMETVRDDPYYLYQIRQAVVYGSYLGEDEALNSLDLAVSLEPKESDRKLQAEQERRRAIEAGQAGVTFASRTHEANWPQQEVLNFLNSRSRIVKVVMMEMADLRSGQRVIFEE